MTVAVLTLCFCVQSLRPPMHRAWTHVTGEITRVLAVRQGVAYYSSKTEVGAIQVSDGKTLWTHKVRWGHPSAINQDTLFVNDQQDEKGTLLAFRLRDGEQHTVVQTGSDVSSLEADATHVFIVSDKGIVTAHPLVGGVSSWTWKAILSTTNKKRTMVDSACGSGKVFVSLSDDALYALDANTGKPEWKYKPSDGYVWEPVVTAFGVYMRGAGMLALADGKELWDPDSRLELKAMVGDVAVVANNGEYVGVDAATGKKLWQVSATAKDLGVSGGENALGPTDGNETVISIHDTTILDKAGHRIWSGERFYTGTPTAVFGPALLCVEDGRLFGYLPGSLPDIPNGSEDKKVMAEKMVAEFEVLDDAEIDLLCRLSPYVSQPLLRRYVTWVKERKEDDYDMATYELMQSADKVLSATTSPADTEALIRAINDLGGGQGTSTLKQILGKNGQANASANVFLAELKAKRHLKGQEASASEALLAVAESKDPRAVAYMIELLGDSTAPAEWRHQAFVHLVASGGDRGIAAVRAARAKRTATPTWQEGFAKDKKLVAEKAGGHGKVWRLYQSPVLGNGSDLYLMKKEAKGWSKPIFTGVFTSRTWDLPEPKEYQGIAMMKLLDGQWVKVLTGDAGMLKDSDGDGLTDLVEGRLGTNPKKKDTDGDGVVDALDPCPNAAPRMLGDREKIIAACVEARFFARPDPVPATIEVKGMTPFEFSGYGGLLVWAGAGYKGSLPKMYGTGVNTIGFGPALEKQSELPNRGADWLKIEPDGKRATTMISRYSGGLNGDGSNVKLVKVGEDWFVVDLELVIMS